jgi:hypothetical protein
MVSKGCKKIPSKGGVAQAEVVFQDLENAEAASLPLQRQDASSP